MTEISPTASREDGLAEIQRRIEEDIIFGRLAPATRLVEELKARTGASRHHVPQVRATKGAPAFALGIAD